VIFGVQKKIKTILDINDRDEKETKLRELAKSLGCSLSSTYEVYPQSAKHLEDEVVARIQAAAKESRESMLWLVALISAIASVISACAAWLAVANS